MTRQLPRSIWTWPLIACLVVLIVGPLAFLFQQSLPGPDFPTYGNLTSSHSVRNVFVSTLQLACWTTALCTLIAIPTATVLYSLRGRWRSFFMWLFVIPLFTSFLVRTYACIALLSRNGPLRLFDALFGWSDTSLLGTFSGVVAANVHMLLPVSILSVYVALDAALGQQRVAAAALGAPPSLQLTGVVLPNVRAAVTAGAALVFMASAGAFIVPALIGGGRQTTVAQLIYVFATELVDPHQSSILALVLTALVAVPAVAVLNSRLAESNAKAVGRRSSLTFAWRLSRVIAPMTDWGLGRAGVKILACTIFVGATLWVFAPLVYVVLVSLQPLPMLALPINGLSLRWYIKVFNDPGWMEATATSLRIAVIVAPLSVAIGYTAAVAVHRRIGPIAASLTVLCVLPLAIPGMALAVGLYGIYGHIGLLGTYTGLIVAHTIAALTFSFLYVRAGLSRYDERLDAAARVLGASNTRTLLKVRLPLLLPALSAAFLLSFLTSFDEFMLTLFLAGADVRTLPLRMWASATQEVGPELAVPGTVILLLSIVVTAICAGLAQAPRFKTSSP